MRLERLTILAAVPTLTLLLAACPPAQREDAQVVEDPAVEPAATPLVATAVLQPREGKTASGTVTFTELDGQVEVVAEVRAVETSGRHGFHLHEHGDCSAPDFTSAGGHFDPHGGRHGSPAEAASHAGDFGNVDIGEDGTGRLVLRTDKLTVTPGPASVVGRAVILHEQRDDLESQPTGDAGGRIACGVVELRPDAAAGARPPSEDAS